MPLVEPSLPVIFVHTHTVHVGLPFFCFCSAPLICLPASSSPCRVAIECLAATINHIAGTERAIRPWPCPTLTACRDARGLAQPAGPRHKGRARRRVVSLLSTTFFPLSLWLAGSGATRRPTWALDSDATIRHQDALPPPGRSLVLLVTDFYARRASSRPWLFSPLPVGSGLSIGHLRPLGRPL